jgi:RimJ/RimL family protein N-acetyltransferase
MERVLIRTARPADCDGAVALNAAVAAEGRWIGREAPLDLAAAAERFLESLDEPGHYVLVAVDTQAATDGSVGGVVGQLHLGVASFGVAELGMAVDAELRGQGVGRRLLATAIDWAREQPGIHKIGLQVWPHNTVAQNLYRSCGFVEEGVLRQHYRRKNGDRWDAVVMGLLLR